MANKWLVHIKKTMRKMKSAGKYVAGKGLKQVIMEAKKTRKKVKKGGGSCDGMKGGEHSDSDEDKGLTTVDLTKKDSATGSTGTEQASQEVAGGKRRRKTRRRRHSRRR
jgi:hypothetical protein